MEIIKGVIKDPQKIVFYGVEGIGKSTFASKFPNPLFIDTEGSTKNLDVARLKKPTSWEYLGQQIDYVKKNKPCKTLVIDTIDWTERLAIEFITARSKKTSITSFGYGEGFIQLEEEFGRFLNKLSDIIEVGINVVLTAHAKIVKFEQPDEMGAYDRWELKLGNKTTAKTAALVKEWADMVLFANYKTVSVATDDKGKKFKGQGGKRVVYTTHHPAWDAKNRHDLPDEMPMEYEAIAHCIPAKSKPSQQQQQQPKQEAAFLGDEPAKAPGTKAPEPLEQEPPEPPKQEPVKQDQPKQDLSGLPKPLADLMLTNEVTIEEIQQAVASRGYYPQNTPIQNYDQNFIDGVLIGAWGQVFQMIKDFRDDLPF